MSPLLDRITAFFLDPPHDGGAPRSAESSQPPDRSARLGLAPATERSVAHGFAPPAPPDQAGQATAATAATAAPAAMMPAALTPSSPARASAAPTPAPPAPAPPASLAFAVILGAPGAAVPVAAACVGELRARARTAAAVLCVWNGGEPPTGATIPAVRRLATRLDAAGLAATPCGRLAWVALDPEPDAAAAQVQRALGVALAGAPLVLAIAGPRPSAFEPFMDEADHAVAVLPADADDALRTLALAMLPARAALVLPPLPPGPPRWAAMAGLARMRALKAAGS